MKSLLFTFITAVAFSGTVEAAEHTRDSLETVQKNLEAQKAVLIDVRELPEWKQAHLVDAMHVPLSLLKSGSGSRELANVLAQQIPKQKIVYAHCAAGIRCRTAADILINMGYDVRPLRADFDELLEAGFPKAKAAK